MGFYDKEENVQQYIEMAKGYDGRELIEILGQYLESGKRVQTLNLTEKGLETYQRLELCVNGSMHSIACKLPEEGWMELLERMEQLTTLMEDCC